MPGGSRAWRSSMALLEAGLRRLLRLLAQFAAKNLADVRFWQLGAKLDVARAFVAGEVRAAVRHQRLRGEPAVPGDDIELHGLARLAVRHADGCALEHALVHRDDALHLVRIHVEARDEDHVLLAIDDPDVTARIHRADVA